MITFSRGHKTAQSRYPDDTTVTFDLSVRTLQELFN